MNRKMKEIFAKMQGKYEEIKNCTDSVASKKLLEEYNELKKQYDLEKQTYEAEKELAAIRAEADPMPVPTSIDPKEEKDKAPKKLTDEEVNAIVVKQVKAILSGKVDKDLSDTVDADGGYLIPVDAQTQINHYKDEFCSFLDDISVENVTKPKGTRVYQKKGYPTAFQELTSDGLIAEDDTENNKKKHKVESPKFIQVAYSIKDYAGFMPVPNNLINDSDANIVETVYKWLALAQVATDNEKILTLFGQTGTSGMGTGWTELDGLDGIKKAVNVDLGQAYAGTVAIYTNDDGLQYLDTLKDTSGRPLLNPIPNEPSKQQLTIGFKTVPVKVKPNAFFKSKAATSAAGGKIPMIIGDLKEATRKYDRQQLVIVASNVAVVDGINAFKNNLTMFRAIMRADYKTIDEDAVVKGYIATPKLASL